MRLAGLVCVVVVAGACAPPECPRVPGLTREQCAVVEAMKLPSTLPRSAGNAVADDQDAAMMGHLVFFDARLSNGEMVRCGTCHIPERYFADGKRVSVGLWETTRNSPSLYSAAFLHWQTWDGKADSLWSQPLLAFENPREMDFTRLELAHRIKQSYQVRYEALFGALPPLDDLVRFPARGKPGDGVWAGMSADDRVAVNRVAANVGKTLEAYLRRLAMRPGAFDAFLNGDAKALSATEQRGLGVFVKIGCAECHSGPMLSDDGFHRLDVPPIAGEPEERGRADALSLLRASEFNANGEFFDGPREAIPATRPEDDFAFHTPSLRNVARSAPYAHDGAFETLEQVVDFHLPVGVSADDRSVLLAFLSALNASDPPSPWNNWPNR